MGKDKSQTQSPAAEQDIVREQSAYDITLEHNEPSYPALQLVTKSRSLARSVALIAQENNLKVEVVAEAKPRVVKFKGVS
jgi:hypothetical protein